VSTKRRPKNEAERQAWLQIYCSVITGYLSRPITEDTYDVDLTDLTGDADGYFQDAADLGRLPSRSSVPSRSKSKPAS
jgi:hypothetical protein